MPFVPPGNETGVYHIPVSGLPWNTDWSKLKDFARVDKNGVPIPIDWVETFPPTDGWVRVIGWENYQRAYARLSGGYMDTQHLIAHDQNENNWTFVNTNEAVLPIKRARHGSASSIKQPRHAHPERHNSTCSLSAINHYEAPNYYAQPFIHFVERRTPPLFDYPNTAPPHAQIILTSVIPFTQYPNSPLFQSLPPPKLALARPLESNSASRPEARKVIITHLPQNTSEAMVREIAIAGAQNCGVFLERDKVRVELVRHTDGRLKSHAFVILESEILAKRIVEGCHGMKWQGQILSARIAKEGVEGRTLTRPTYHSSRSSPTTRSEVGGIQTQMKKFNLSKKREFSLTKGIEKEKKNSFEAEEDEAIVIKNGREVDPGPLVVDGTGLSRKL